MPDSLKEKNGLERKRPRKVASYFDGLKERYEFTRRNEHLTIPEVIDAVKTSPITTTPLITDVGTQRLIVFSRKIMEEALKTLKIGSKFLTRRCNAILLPTEEAKMLAGNTVTTKSVRLQTEYLGTRLTNITFHGVPVNITADRLGAFWLSTDR